ncbi:antibiotic ABC transporter ATP-binding protein [Caloranaerobacter azorensis H53214]|uniref:Antibiotic ABC transporter ATP-binding protein n=1 Tax=Caloranaerobacter azorensis H53214 TaxID=1156417 RepID=A0A096DM55_9FIRM|nr:daunorubicin resistance protein DrrA family ABC transporter ATP-binding protein [Caloranaerobacter azorensis]KGG80371.1 antibiotic ABC transporter ATP-binding protein [Caloranaerobacter azorensis H53214]
MTLLRVDNLKKYFKKIKAVDGISFEVKKGEILGLLGPNGAGKSTTISMISTLFKPTSGDIFFKGKSIFENPIEIRKNIGIVPQEIALYPTLSGYENLRFWGNAYGLRGKKLKIRIEEVSEIIGIKDRLKDKVEKYSGGMKRRINIGAALLHKPQLLIMDEPTVGIDPQSRKHILDTVLSLNKEGMTVIYTSHYMEEVEYLCNRISIMDKGKIIATGTKDELINIVNGQKVINLKFDKISKELIRKIKDINYVSQIEVLDDEIILTTVNENTIFKDIIDKVSETDSNILSIDVKKPNLESVFLHLTGKALRD